MNILLTSAGRRSYLVHYFKEALAGKAAVHASNSRWSTALEVADEAVLTPLIYDEHYITFLLDYCMAHDIKAVISLFDIDLPVLARARERFQQEGIQVIVSDYRVTQICNDKWKTYLFLKENKFHAPQSFIALDQLQQALQDKRVRFPLIIKPRWGMGSISIFKADNNEELNVFYAKVKREIQASYLKYESEGDPDHSVIIQEFLNGQEYGLDIINDLDKNYLTTFVKKKTGMRAGETDGAITVKHETLQQLGQHIAVSLGHIANLDTDCFMVGGRPYILEMNCRFGGGYPFSHLAGANLPAAILKWLQGEDAMDELMNYRFGVEGRKDISLIRCKGGC